jgi:hypothetical protein
MDDEAVVAKLEEVWRAHVPGDPRKQLEQWRQREPDAEHQLTVATAPSQHLFVLICGWYGLRPHRRPRQRVITLCLEAPAGFVDQILWPLFVTSPPTGPPHLPRSRGATLGRPGPPGPPRSPGSARRALSLRPCPCATGRRWWPDPRSRARRRPWLRRQAAADGRVFAATHSRAVNRVGAAATSAGEARSTLRM